MTCYNNYTKLKTYLKNDGYLLFLSILLIFITPLDYILYVRWIDGMSNYNWYASSFIFPLFGIFFFFIGTRYLEYNNKIKDINKMSQKPLMYLGIMDGLNSLLGSFSTPYLSIVVMTILDKFSLPLILVSSCFLLKRKYRKNHYLGVFLTLYAIMVSFLPSFTNGKYNHSWATILFTLSLIPGVLSYVFKEKFLDNRPINEWWMNLWISVWQFLFGFITFPLMLIPLKAPIGNNIPIDEVGGYIINATVCQFAGINKKVGDDCVNNLLLMIIYQIVSTIINILMFKIIREGSSTYFVLINSLKIPIQAWLASYKFLAGRNYSPISWNDFFSFILLIVATIVYNDKSEINQDTPILNLSILNDDLYNDVYNEDLNDLENRSRDALLTINEMSNIDNPEELES